MGKAIGAINAGKVRSSEKAILNYGSGIKTNFIPFFGLCPFVQLSTSHL